MAATADDLRRELELERKLLMLDAPNVFSRFLVYANSIYQAQWFHTLIADRCQALLEGDIQNLMIFLPPQHGKSEITSRNFPAFALGRNPDLKIVGCSYSADLAEQFSRAIQNTINSEEYHRIFPDTFLSKSIYGGGNRSKSYICNSDYFETVGHRGFYKAVGVGGSLTGTPVDIAIIDDPVKDAVEAYSPTYRERVWNWYTSVLMTRLHNASRQLFIMTRWHEDDLAGRILATEPEKWEVISIPAIREDDSCGYDPRQIGEALWEKRHSLERLLEAEARSPRTFAALYQQRPSVIGGNIIKRDWFGHVSVADFNRIHNPKTSPMIFFIDTAYTDKTSNDPTGILACCRIANDLYIVDAKKVNYKFPDLIRFLPEYVKSHGYVSSSSVRIEPKANGLSVIDQLRESTELNVVATPTPQDGKETRLNAASPTVESGRVILVDGAWNEAFIHEVCSFPAAPHDEFVDDLCYAIDHLLQPDKSIDLRRLAKIVRR